MKLILIIFFTLILFTSCDEQIEVKHLTKDFNLAWWAEPREQSLYHNSSHNEFGGLIVIPETVYAIGFDDDFIIAKQHPNKAKQIQDRLFNKEEGYDDYLLQNAADTVWLSAPDSIYEKDGKWFHISNGWSPPRNLFPYKDSTYYFIIDVRDYDIKDWNSSYVYKFDTEANFNIKRNEIGVDKNLNFSITNKNLE